MRICPGEEKVTEAYVTSTLHSQMQRVKEGKLYELDLSQHKEVSAQILKQVLWKLDDNLPVRLDFKDMDFGNDHAKILKEWLK